MEAQDPAQEAARVLVILLVEASRFTGEIEDAALEYWRQRYQPKFERAIRAGQDYRNAERMLKRRAKEIGSDARHRAGNGPVKEEHAKAASQLKDCKSEEDWCY